MEFSVIEARHSSEVSRPTYLFGTTHFIGTWDECRAYCRGYAGNCHTRALVIMDRSGIERDRWED